jgi:pre-rRNA-processing protein TSR2
MVIKFEEQSEKMKGAKLGVQEVANDDDEWEDSEDESDDDDEAPTLLRPPEVSPKEPPQVDEDGFTTVKKKGRR